MTNFDTIFDNACNAAGLSWLFIYDNKDRNLKVDGEMTDVPCVLRWFREEVLPLFDQLQRVERTMLLYIVHVGFESTSSEDINENLEDVMNKFIAFRDYMKRAGVEVAINGRPFPQWEQTDYDEYGLVFNLTVKYSICQP